MMIGLMRKDITKVNITVRQFGEGWLVLYNSHKSRTFFHKQIKVVIIISNVGLSGCQAFSREIQRVKGSIPFLPTKVESMFLC